MNRWIDADALIDRLDTDEYGMRLPKAVVGLTKVLLDDAPSIDIVRCGECIHNGSYDTDCPFGWRNGEWNMPKPCDFCSYGERNK